MTESPHLSVLGLNKQFVLHLLDGLVQAGLDGMECYYYRDYGPGRQDELVARATAYPLLFKPGTDYAYSDTNYLVLGMLVQRITGHITEGPSMVVHGMPDEMGDHHRQHADLP